MSRRVEEILLVAGLSILAVLGIIVGRKLLIKKLPAVDDDDNNTTTPKAKVNNILFVGDSITAEYYKGSRVTWVYSSLIKNKLTDKTVDILAVGGMKTSWMLSNLPAQLAKRKYDRVYIWGGINDVYWGLAASKIVANVQAMVNLVVAQGGKAYVIIGYDTNKFTPDSKVQKTDYVTREGMIVLRDNYIEYQQLLKSTIKNATIVNEFDLNSTYNADGIHPTVAAHKIISNILLKDIK